MCAATLASKVLPGHTHRCALDHTAGNHMTRRAGAGFGVA